MDSKKETWSEYVVGDFPFLVVAAFGKGVCVEKMDCFGGEDASTKLAEEKNLNLYNFKFLKPRKDNILPFEGKGGRPCRVLT